MKHATLLGALLASALIPAAAPAAVFVTAQPAQMIGAPKYRINPIYTVGDALPGNGYRAPGILDGIGAYKLNDSTVRLLVNSELPQTAGSTYSLANGVALKGARVSYFDVNIASRDIVGGGVAYNAIFDRTGAAVTSASQINGGISRLCSSAAFEGNSYGGGGGVVDRMYLAGEETSGGTMYALDTATNAMHAVPMFGRMAFENAAQVNTGTTNKVAFLLSDDSSGAAAGADQGTAMYMYVGTKNAKGDGSFLDRNGLAQGDLFVWVSNEGKTNPSNFGGKGSTSGGHWEKIENTAAPGTPGYDAQGFANTQTIRDQANAKGAFKFSRPEDISTNPEDGTLVAFASTGSNRFGGADTWGTVYTIDVNFDGSGNPAATTFKVVYDGNQDSTRALRSPDNLDWSGADKLIVQEDRSTDWLSAISANPNEASILELDLAGNVTRVATMDRSAIPAGQLDTAPADFGNWESSGVLDVSTLFGFKPGTLFVADTQAHSLRFSNPALNSALVEGGQLFFIQAVPEPASWAMMIAGFGIAGSAARRRRVKLRFA